MPANYADLLSDDGWEPLDFSAPNPNFYWHDGRFLADAPVDVEATLGGALFGTTVVDPWFQWRPRRVKPGFTIPSCHHNLGQLVIVLDGDIEVAYGREKGAQTIGATEFWVCEAGTPYSVTAGPQGATYVESWDGPMALIETYWHDDATWVRR